MIPLSIYLKSPVKEDADGVQKRFLSTGDPLSTPENETAPVISASFDKRVRVIWSELSSEALMVNLLSSPTVNTTAAVPDGKSKAARKMLT